MRSCRQEQHVFNANGFDFKELEDGQVQLTAVPFSKEAVFGPQDVHELLHLLMHGQGSAFKMQTQQPVTPSQPFLPSQAAIGPSTKIVRPSRCDYRHKFFIVSRAYCLYSEQQLMTPCICYRSVTSLLSSPD